MYLSIPLPKGHSRVPSGFRQSSYQGCLERRRGALKGSSQQWQQASSRIVLQPCRALEDGGPGTEQQRSKRARHQTPHSRATVVRMSASATGRRHSTSTIRKIGESKRGQTLSASHRAAISAGQKRRHAARRFLVAMEAMHQELIVTCDDTEVDSPPADGKDPSLLSTLPQSLPQTVPKTFLQPSSESPAPAESGTAANSSVASNVSDLRTDEDLDEVQREYRMRLKEFRRLQSQVRPWLDSFEKNHGYRPSAADVSASGDAKIWDLYQKYQNHRDSLMVEIPAMRAAMSKGDTGSSGSAATTSKSRSSFNSNRTDMSSADAASRLEAARQYKKKKEATSGAGAGDAASGGNSAMMRIMGLRAKASVGKGSDSSRAKAAVLKALEYKQRQGAEKVSGGNRRTGTAGSAVRLVAVEGKAIGGIDYSSVDASQAAAGESQHIKAGSPVQSYRRVSEDDGCGLVDAFQSMQSSKTANSAGSVESREQRDIRVKAEGQSETEKSQSQQEDKDPQAGQSHPARTSERSVEALQVLLSAASAGTQSGDSTVVDGLNTVCSGSV